jgi:two-component system, sensor histidine kinase and response regulator
MDSYAASLDPERIAMLRELDDGDGELMATLAREYERDSERQLTTMHQALTDRDAHSLERAAHTLKGASANLGATRLAELCARLQELGRAEELDGAASLVAAAVTELDRVNRELHELPVTA